MVPSITQEAVETALGDLLKAILPAGVEIVVGQTNRVPSPEDNYVTFWPLRRPRLGTNYETPIDTKFTASMTPIDANTATMAVTAIATGSIEPSNQVFGVGVADSTVVVSQTSGGVGGIGNYVVSPAQTVASTTMSAGVLEIAQSTEVVYQIDVHGPNSADNAQVISTVSRSEFAVNQMAGTGVTPLFADDPNQAAFMTAASQYEDRWTVDIHLQITPTISTPQQFSDSIALTVVDVDVAFPAT